MARTFLTAEWRKLAMVQHQVEPAALAPWMPAGIELDLFEGRCLVSLVGFLFDRVRVLGVPVPWHTRFPEVNLRFYVRQRMSDGSVRRGVVFVSEIVPRPAITWVARGLYEEPYRTLPMRYRIDRSAAGLEAAYGWRLRGQWQELEVSADPHPRPIAPGSIEEFITEHYFGYTKRRSGATSEYGVEHPRWAAYPVRNSRVDVDYAALYGPVFAALRGAEPQSVLLAEGSAVRVYQGQTIPAKSRARPI